MGNERQRVELLAQSDDEEGSKMKYRYEESTFLRSNELDVDAVFSIASGVVSLQGRGGFVTGAERDAGKVSVTYKKQANGYQCVISIFRHWLGGRSWSWAIDVNGYELAQFRSREVLVHELQKKLRYLSEPCAEQQLKELQNKSVPLQGAEGERLCEWHYRDMGFGYRNYYAACNRAGTVMSESTDYCPKCGGKVVMLGEVAA